MKKPILTVLNLRDETDIANILLHGLKALDRLPAGWEGGEVHVAPAFTIGFGIDSSRVEYKLTLVDPEQPKAKDPAPKSNVISLAARRAQRRR